jgi:hypothetical protein
VTVTFNSTGLVGMTYNASLCVTSNDPDPGPGQGTNFVIVHVSMTVTGAPCTPPSWRTASKAALAAGLRTAPPPGRS